jgi:hypothetical protein
VEITVLIEPLGDAGFRASTGQPLGCEAHGATRAEALSKLEATVQASLSGGAELARIRVAAGVHPLAPFAGCLKDRALADAWRAAVAEYREQAG